MRQPPFRYISAFDLDRTLVRANSSFRFTLQLIKHKKMPYSTLFHSVIYYIRHTMGWLPLEEMHKMVFSCHLKGYPHAVLVDEVKQFIAQLQESDFYLPALHHFRRAKEMGHYTVLLSSSPNFLVEPLGEYFGFDETFSSVYEVDKENDLCHISTILQGEGKAKILADLAKNLGVGKEHTIAYSDSHLDLHFLQEAGVAVAVNPEGKLKRYSKKKNWLII